MDRIDRIIAILEISSNACFLLEQTNQSGILSLRTLRLRREIYLTQRRRVRKKNLDLILPTAFSYTKGSTRISSKTSCCSKTSASCRAL